MLVFILIFKTLKKPFREKLIFLYLRFFKGKKILDLKFNFFAFLFLDKIKVKVITTKDKFGKMSKGDELISSDQLDDVKDMFLGILVCLFCILYNGFSYCKFSIFYSLYSLCHEPGAREACIKRHDFILLRFIPLNPFQIELFSDSLDHNITVHILTGRYMEFLDSSNFESLPNIFLCICNNKNYFS